MADNKSSDTTGIAKSFADRLSFPDKTNGTSSDKPTEKFNWADEVETPSEASPQPAPIEKVDATEATTKEVPAKPAASNDSSLTMAQGDGASTWLNGSGLDEPEFDVNVKLADLQGDPNSPLNSIKSFDELNLSDALQRSLALNGFHKPSKIQERALPLLMKNPASNFIGQSQSGTGKTAAFTLNMLTRIDLTNPSPQCLVLAPTRELARQIASVAKMLGMFMEADGLTIGEAIPNPANRGKPVNGQIIVGTPGTVMDVMKRRQLDTRSIKVLTLDEADNMLDIGGMGDQCQRVKQQLSKNAQIVLFSATFPDQVLNFANTFAPKSNQITLEVEKLTVKGIKQMYLDCDSDEAKYEALLKFYSLMTIASSIIFVRRRDTATEIEKRMVASGHAVAALSGALEGSERDAVFNRFRTGEAKVLITTNVLARGIDVQTVTMVINYDVPTTQDHQPDYETYLHRIGRTGRFGRTGAALTFVHDRRSWEMLQEIGRHFGIEPTRLDTSDWDAVEKMLKGVMKNARNAGAKEEVKTEPVKVEPLETAKEVTMDG
ncbi:RNA helicase required for poly(A+) mRNA export [Oleoguttula sp. CCFEE 5521]